MRIGEELKLQRAPAQDHPALVVKLLLEAQASVEARRSVEVPTR